MFTTLQSDIVDFGIYNFYSGKSKRQSLKFQRFTPSSWNDIQIRKLKIDKSGQCVWFVNCETLVLYL